MSALKRVPASIFIAAAVGVAVGWLAARLIMWTAERDWMAPAWSKVAMLAVALGVSITFNVTGIRNGDTSVPVAAADKPAIAVLPFTSLSSDPDNAVFADGIHGDILTQLASIGSCTVISRSSVMEYRNTTKNVRQIGDELDVDTVLQGSVQRVGDNVRINVQLVDAENDVNVWAKTYDRRLTAQNIFAIQSDISRAIAVALERTLTPAEQVRIAARPTDGGYDERFKMLDFTVVYTGFNLSGRGPGRRP